MSLVSSVVQSATVITHRSLRLRRPRQVQRRLNVAFSTSRQWNPGDEAILFGVLNIFRSLRIEINPVIYNRNPDVRSMHQDIQKFKSSMFLKTSGNMRKRAYWRQIL